MKHTWLKRWTAWLLAALLLTSPALAEWTEAATLAECVEDAVAEAEMFELGEDAPEAEIQWEIGDDIDVIEAVEAPPVEDLDEEAADEPGEVLDEESSEAEIPEEEAMDPTLSEAEPIVEPGEESEAEPTEEAPSDDTKTEPAEDPAEAPADETTGEPAAEPTDATEAEPTDEPGAEPTGKPEAESTEASEKESSDAPSQEAQADPDAEASVEPSIEPSIEPGVEPSVEPSIEPSVEPSVTPSIAPSATPEVAVTEAPAAPKLEAAPAQVLPSEVLMGKGEKRALTPIFDGAGAVEVAWSSSKPNTVAVSKAGKLTAKRRGSAVVTMTAANGVTASCLVRVFKAPSKVSVKPGKKLSMGLGEVYALSGKLPSGSYSALSWSSSKPGVASVDAEGRVTALSPGTAKITVKTFNGKKAACKVSVYAAPGAVAFSVGDQAVGVGMTVDLKPVVNPGAAGHVTLSSSAPGVASVSGSKVTGVNPGTAVITGTTYNGLSTALTVTVLPAPTAVGLAYTTLYLGVGEKLKLEPATNPGSATAYSFKSASKKIASVSAAGVVKGRRKGTTKVTVTTHNGLKVKVKIVVRKAPSKLTLKPKTLAMEVGGTHQLTVSLPKGTASTITFTSSNPSAVTVDAAGLLRAVGPGTSTVTAVTYNKKKATCKVTVGGGAYGSLSLNTSGMVMMPLGGKWALTASSTTGSLDGIAWATTSSSIARVSASGGACTVTGAGKGTAIVTAKLPDGSYASVIFMVVDVSDTSAANFNAVQKALLTHESLIDSAAGGNVIWDLIAARLLKANYQQSQVNDLIARLKAADATYRNLYIYSFGTYTQSAERAGLSASYFDQASNMLYLKKSSQYSGSDYAYVVFHESGHAIDWNADGNSALNSLNANATSAVLADVRSLLTERVSAAVVSAGVNAASVNTGKVVDMLMNYKVLTDPSLLNGLNDAERVVYTQLSNAVAGEMNNTLPTNNGCMIWDSVEGATNYAVHGKFGHYYLLADGSEYKAEATYYFWNLKGEPQITTEPWAEFFSANIMGDSNTLSLNWSYLPQTCKYFAETLVPQMMSYFTNRIKSL